MTVPSSLAAICAAAVVLAGCGSDRSEPSTVQSAVLNLAKASLARASGTPPQAAVATQPTRAELEAYGLSILRVVISSRGADALVTVTDTKGAVVTWATTDGTTFTLRDGVLIQTRGLGPDLMSSAAPWPAELSASGGSYQRAYFFLGDDDQTSRRIFDCKASKIGAETVEIFGRAHQTVRIQEVCIRPEGKIANDFWMEGAVVRKSRQWASPGTGYIEFELAVD